MTNYSENYVNWFERHSEKNVRCVHTDIVQVSTQKEEVPRMDMTVTSALSFSLQSGDLAGRINRFLVEKGCAMLYDSDLKLKY